MLLIFIKYDYTLKKKGIQSFRVILESTSSAFHDRYYWSGVKFDNLPSASLTSLGFLKFSKIPDIVWMDFLVSGLKINYMGMKDQIEEGSITFYWRLN